MGSHADPPIAASDTKHLPILHHPIPRTSVVLPLRQITADSQGAGTGTTGTTLWLSSQLLALYFASLPPPAQNGTKGQKRKKDEKKKVILDLGSGIGFLPLCLAQRGWGTVATDVPSVIDSVLHHNISEGLKVLQGIDNHLDPPEITVTTLDWETVSQTRQLPESLEGIKIEIIITSDTIYAPHLLSPLLTTLWIISSAQSSAPTVYISLERRDSALVDSALETAGTMGLSLRRVDKDRIDRLMAEAGWEKEGWDDVEIWKGKFSKASLASR